MICGRREGAAERAKTTCSWHFHPRKIDVCWASLLQLLRCTFFFFFLHSYWLITHVQRPFRQSHLNAHTEWGLCTSRYGIQISMEAILACHPARSTASEDCHPKSCELWRIRTGPIWARRTICCLKHNTGKENKARERNLKGQKDGELVIKGYLKRERERERERERPGRAAVLRKRARV